MAKKGGFPGGGMPGNMNNLMKQAQRMQRQMEESQKDLEIKEFIAKAGGGAVEVTCTGKKEIRPPDRRCRRGRNRNWDRSKSGWNWGKCGGNRCGGGSGGGCFGILHGSQCLGYNGGKHIRCW